MNAKIAVKAFIIKDDSVLLLKRGTKDEHKPGAWDIPGGRLEEGENPFDGIQRETKEETGLTIAITLPIDIQHFVRDDGQTITMIIFLATLITSDITLSEEHDQYTWVKLSEKDIFPTWLLPVIDNINTYIRL